MHDLKSFLGTNLVMPAMPNVIIRALNIIKDETTGIKELAQVISYDQALSTKVLKLVNSAYYGFPQQITSINKALTLLGMVQAKNIIIAVAMKPMMTSQGGKELWQHSIKCAVACEYLAKEYRTMDPSEAFVLGFLHDIGKVLLILKNASIYTKVQYLVNKGAEIIDAESMFFGVDHAELGLMLAKNWKLPILITNCIKYHHTPHQSSVKNVAILVYIADKIVQDKLKDPILDPQIMMASNIKIQNIEEIREKILKEADELIEQLTV